MIEGTEVWKDVFGFEGIYQVSNLGHVRSIAREVTNNVATYFVNEKILKDSKSANGYLKVDLYANGKRKTCYVHRLVAQAFLPNPEELTYVNHKNEVKADNRLSNLEWCTAQYNNEYSDIYSSQRRRVLQLSKNMSVINTYASQSEAERKTGISQGDISKCCLGKRKTAGGYIWKFKE